jgi:hypothetical protein
MDLYLMLKAFVPRQIEVEMKGWTDLAKHRFEIIRHPLETFENIEDIRHFTVIHGNSKVCVK